MILHNLLEKKNYVQSAIEANILNEITKGNRIMEGISERLNMSDSVILQELQMLVDTGMLSFNYDTKEYEYAKPIIGEPIFLDGDMFIPASFVYLDDKLMVSRGDDWYQFDRNLDIRRIQWNSVLPYEENGEIKTDTTLFDMLKNSVNKQRKTRNKQLSEYDNLRDKIVPYSDTLKIRLLTIGEEQTDVNLMFILPISVDSNNDLIVEFRKFAVKQAISTEQLILALRRPQQLRNFQQDIALDRMIPAKDMFFTGNCIPVRWTNEDKSSFEFIELSQIKKDSLTVTRKEYTTSGETYLSDMSMSPNDLQQELSEEKEFPLLYSILKDNEFILEYL